MTNVIFRSGLALILLSPAIGFATPYMTTIEGVLASYDAKIATIEQPGGAKLIVPSSAIPHKEGLITGKAHVTVSVSAEDLVALNPAVFKSKSAPNKTRAPASKKP